MNGGRLKQILYGAGFLLFFSAVIFGIYVIVIKPPASCVDKKQNQKETGIDCGGPCAPCEQKYAKDLTVESIGKFSGGDTKTVIAAYVENPNDEYGIKDVVYTMVVKDTDDKELQTITEHTFMYDHRAKSGRYLLATVDFPVENIGDVSMTFSGAVVVPRDEFNEPNVVAKESSTDITGVKRLMVPVYVFTRDIGAKTVGDDVLQLETFLSKKGLYKATPDTKYDANTKLALIQYQKSKKITPASGIFGPKTRKILNAEIEKTVKVTVEADSAVTVGGSVKNNGVTEATRTIVTSLLYDATGVQIGASKTELENVQAAEERPFKIVFPKTVQVYLIDPIRTQVFVDSI